MLTPSGVQNAKPQAKPYKLTDGGGMFLVVTPTGGKWWRLKYRRPDSGKENLLSLGTFPEVSLRKARDRRDEARRQLADGIDPGVKRQADHRAARVAATNTLEAVARAWLDTKAPEWVPDTHRRATAWLEGNVFGQIGNRPISALEFDAPAILDVLRKMADRGTVYSAHRVREYLGAIFRFAIANGFAKHDPVADLRGALPRAQGGHFGAITRPDEIAALLRAIEDYHGAAITRAALRLSPLVFQRPGELRQAQWAHIDLDGGVWRIPAALQKLTRAKKESTRTPDHIVLLSTQAVEVLRELQPLTGKSAFVFPGASGRPMSENTVRAALRRLGYTNDEMTAHGFRHMASTRLNEMGVFNPDAIEAALAHKMPGIRGVYAGRAQYLDERRRMMQEWADYLDVLRTGGNVVPIRAIA